MQIALPNRGARRWHEVRRTDLEFRFEARSFIKALPEAYERLLLDVLGGDASLFAAATRWNWPGAS